MTTSMKDIFERFWAHTTNKIDALNRSKLNSSELPSAINTALAQAKESGEFNGAKGDPGYTPVKGTDYYTEADKTELVNQVISTLPTWNGGSY